MRMTPDPAYVIITPVRDEEAYFQRTIDSVVSQTIPPAAWIIVNDGSKDETGRIADEAARQHQRIRVIQRQDRGFRQPGGGIVDAFYEGFALAREIAWEFIVKLDGDLSFAPDYFSRCFAHFRANPRLGIAGGMICTRKNGAMIEEFPDDPVFHVRGATKVYRRACWDEIGELIRAAGWDTLDEVKATMKGWETRTLRDVLLVQHRVTGGAAGTWRNYVKNGQGGYILGYHPLFMFCKCLRRLLHWPFGVISLGLATGYVRACLARTPRQIEPEVLRYIRREQLKRVFGVRSIWR